MKHDDLGITLVESVDWENFDDDGDRDIVVARDTLYRNNSTNSNAWPGAKTAHHG